MNCSIFALSVLAGSFFGSAALAYPCGNKVDWAFFCRSTTSIHQMTLQFSEGDFSQNPGPIRCDHTGHYRTGMFFIRPSDPTAHTSFPDLYTFRFNPSSHLSIDSVPNSFATWLPNAGQIGQGARIQLDGNKANVNFAVNAMNRVSGRMENTQVMESFSCEREEGSGI